MTQDTEKHIPCAGSIPNSLARSHGSKHLGHLSLPSEVYQQEVGLEVEQPGLLVFSVVT